VIQAAASSCNLSSVIIATLGRGFNSGLKEYRELEGKVCPYTEHGPSALLRGTRMFLLSLGVCGDCFFGTEHRFLLWARPTKRGSSEQRGKRARDRLHWTIP